MLILIQADQKSTGSQIRNTVTWSVSLKRTVYTRCRSLSPLNYWSGRIWSRTPLKANKKCTKNFWQKVLPGMSVAELCIIDTWAGVNTLRKTLKMFLSLMYQFWKCSSCESNASLSQNKNINEKNVMSKLQRNLPNRKHIKVKINHLLCN